MSQDNLFRNIDDLKKYIKSFTTKIVSDDYLSPSLQSDYTIAIYRNFDDYKNKINPAVYEPVLIHSLSLPLSNGVSVTMDKLGLQAADFSATNKMSFEFIAVPYSHKTGAHLTAQETIYTSLVHFYYAQRFTDKGTLKIKREGDALPTVFVINLKTNNIVYVLKNCVFSYPTFQVSPSSNSIAVYRTEVTFSSYRAFLEDNINDYNISQTMARDVSEY